MMVHFNLESDPHADNLRATLTEFDISMSSASEEIYSSLTSGQRFYVHDLDEYTSVNVGPEVAAERAKEILSPEFQARVLKFARGAVTSAANAAKIIRGRAIPLIPLIEKDLEEYLSGYLSRADIQKAREKSWMPSILQDMLMGSLAPTPVNPEDVRQLQEQLAESRDLLRQLPAFLDNLELHFRRLSDLKVEEVAKQGYTTFDDLSRLYYDRLCCNYALKGMVTGWLPAISAFRLSSGKFLRYGVD